MKCKRHSTWIINGGYGEWCYVCGAYRRLTQVGANTCKPGTTWVLPTGDKENNPYSRMRELN